jgi:hypothetical protein
MAYVMDASIQHGFTRWSYSSQPAGFGFFNSFCYCCHDCNYNCERSHDIEHTQNVYSIPKNNRKERTVLHLLRNYHIRKYLLNHRFLRA